MEKMMIKQTINFSQLHEQQLRRLFNLKEDLTRKIIENWKNKANQVVISNREQETINRIFAKTERYGRSWNKAERMLKCVAPLIELVDFDNLENGLAAIYNRSLSYEYENWLMEGNVDAMITSNIPHFALNVFEKDEVLDNEPTGELLAALLAIQQNGKNPVYGVYIIRQMWLFIVLDNQQYAFSKALMTDKKEQVEGIFKMLKAQKEMIFEMAV